MAQKKDPVDQVSGLLRTLGETADEVAGALRANGCRGFRGGNSPNPVIRYLYRRFDDGTLDLVYGPSLAEYEPEALVLHLSDGRREELILPAPVKEFLTNFDLGLYPELQLPERI
jgi:hypothetical protein